MSEFLFHGTSNEAWRRIQREGVDGPSYWGTLEVALPRAENGVLLRVPADRFDPDGLMPNTLLADALGEDEPCTPPENWQESLAELGSVRYDFSLQVSEDDLYPLKIS